MNSKELKNYRQIVGLTRTKKGIIIPVPQKKFAEILNISLSYYEKMEQGKLPIPDCVKERLESYFRYHMKEGADMNVMIDYLRLSFFDTSPEAVITRILEMEETMFETRATGLYRFDQIAVCGNIWVFWHTKETNKNVLVQFSGQGCREYENLLEDRELDWQRFLRDIWQKQGRLESGYSRVQCSRIDIAIDEQWTREDAEYFDLFLILEKWQKGLVESRFKLFENYSSIYTESGIPYNNGLSLYFGSRKSPLFFNFYEKRFELARKERLSVDEALLKYGIQNRYEVRCSNEKAMGVIKYFIQGMKLGEIGAGLINSKVIVYDELDSKTRIVNERWAKMFQTTRELNFKMKAERFSIERAEGWFETQVAPTLKLLKQLDEVTGENFVDTTIENAVLNKDKENYLTWFQSSDVVKSDQE